MFAKAFNVKRQSPAGKVGQDYHKKVKVTRGNEKIENTKKSKKEKIRLDYSASSPSQL